ncbi:MAG: TOBE domain-containing protein [Acetobacteraceae bacterium]|nr:TOBE domain-containing protein [Acetobacteraceae bacterium]
MERIELRRLQQQIGLTTVYVTHDQSEALAMSDLIAVMELGRIAQMDEPRAIYFRPANEFVASFIGAANLVRGVCVSSVAAGTVGAVRLEDGVSIRCVFPSGGAEGRAVTVSLRPESMTIATAADPMAPDMNVLDGIVTAGSFLGGSARYDVQAGPRILRVSAPAEVAIPNGSPVWLTSSSHYGQW